PARSVRCPTARGHPGRDTSGKARRLTLRLTPDGGRAARPSAHRPRSDVTMVPGMASSPARETWVDVAKGGAIVLVVLFHAALFLDDVGLAWLWPRAGTALDTFRMPLFFSTAGLFAAKTLALDLRTVLRRRVARLVWVYVLWSLVWTLAFQVL